MEDKPSYSKGKGPLDDSGIREVLAQAKVGFLSTLGADGQPHVVPLSFAEEGGRIYFHGPSRGQKIDDIRGDPRASFSAAVIDEERFGPAPCDTTCLFRSVVAEGEAAIVSDRAQAIKALAALTRKYAPWHASPAFEERRLAKTLVIELLVARWTGKYHR